MATPLIQMQAISKWYGHLIALKEIHWSFEGGVVGIVGPNGAGKTTLLRLLTGQLSPSTGQVRVFGENPLFQSEVFRQIGFAPEIDLPFDYLTPMEFLRGFALLLGFPSSEAKERAEQALERVQLLQAQNRKIGTFSKGMRQRVKVARALLGDPKLLILDEPFTGMDPVARHKMVEFLQKYTSSGEHHIILSSHILHEVESLTHQILLLHKGRILAQGSLEEIRAQADERPHSIWIGLSQPRQFAKALIDKEWVQGIDIRENGLYVRSSQPAKFYRKIAKIISQQESEIEELFSEDESLESIFHYLVVQKGGKVG